MMQRIIGAILMGIGISATFTGEILFGLLLLGFGLLLRNERLA